MQLSQKMSHELIVLLSCLVLLGCASSPPSANSAGQRHVQARVIRIMGIPTTSNATESGRDLMTNVSTTQKTPYGGAIGSAMYDLLSTKHGYPVYALKQLNGPEMRVASFEKFEVGDCVEVWFPESMGDSPDLGLGNAGIKKSSDCTTLEAK